MPCAGAPDGVYYNICEIPMGRRTYEAHGHRRQQHPEPGLLRHPAAHHPGRAVHPRRVRLFYHAVAAAGGGAARRSVCHLRCPRPHLPPHGGRRLQGHPQAHARGAAGPGAGFEGGPGRAAHPPLRAGGLGGRRPDRHHLPQVRGGRLGLRGGHRRQGQPPAHHRPHQGEAGLHPHGADHHQGHDPRDLPGAIWLRSHPHDRPQGPHGGQLRQHPRRPRRGGKDRHGSHPEVCQHRRAVCRHAGCGGQARRDQEAGGGGGGRPALLLAGHHRHRCAAGLPPPGQPGPRSRAGGVPAVFAAGVHQAHRKAGPDGGGGAGSGAGARGLHCDRGAGDGARTGGKTAGPLAAGGPCVAAGPAGPDRRVGGLRDRGGQRRDGGAVLRQVPGGLERPAGRPVLRKRTSRRGLRVRHGPGGLSAGRHGGQLRSPAAVRGLFQRGAA